MNEQIQMLVSQVQTLTQQVEALTSASAIQLYQDQGLRSRFQNIFFYRYDIDLGNIGGVAGSPSPSTFNIPAGDAQVGDIPILGIPNAIIASNTFTAQGWITTNGVVNVKLINHVPGTPTFLGSLTWYLAVVKKQI